MHRHLILHFQLATLWLRDCPHLAQEPPMVFLTHQSLDGNHLALPFPLVTEDFKSSRRKEALFSASRYYLHPPCSLLYLPSLTFNKLHLYLCVWPWILSSGTQRICKSSDHRLHCATNSMIFASFIILLYISYWVSATFLS
jgi:hypothetical protein